jgi:hypothetical protein
LISKGYGFKAVIGKIPKRVNPLEMGKKISRRKQTGFAQKERRLTGI